MSAELIGSFIAWAFVLPIYFLPTYIAAKRRHKNSTPILLMNLFIGWTGIGWIVCLIWSTTSNVKERI